MARTIIDFTIDIADGGDRMYSCDVCTEVRSPDFPRFVTFVGGIPQSDVCADCIEDILAHAREWRRKNPREAVA